MLVVTTFFSVLVVMTFLSVLVRAGNGLDRPDEEGKPHVGEVLLQHLVTLHELVQWLNVNHWLRGLVTTGTPNRLPIIEDPQG